MEVGRVQDIASSALFSGSLPAEFVRPDTEQPGITTVKGQLLAVPVIDFKNPDEDSVIRAIDDASRNWGMFQIINHDIPNEAIAHLQAVGKAFFELPPEEKEVYAKPPDSKSVEGYGTKLQKEVDGKKGWVDHLFHIIWPPSAINFKFWPQNPPSYRAANEEYRKHLHGVVDKLFRSLSLGLGLEGHELKESAGGDKLVYLLKINYYPPCPCPDLALGVPAHTDMSTITILVPNDVQGLQAFRDGHWYNVNYIPNALVIHIGDQIEILSNGKYKSVLHRTTVKKDRVRISWPVFLEPPPEFEVGPHPKLVDQDNPPKYKTKKYGEYAYCKLNKIPQ
ncbi:flavonol synthase/flavanone 3-hydroxylase-like [Cucurbita pepo subsp. pepo]|uniref:flavonol synthase/flavanone 3-hydroxylase-like n=1 Tax=Cucurbita pepo subsp. pepo TaxID=3664 RepID=UPI000C9D4F26|nr:flavonol synthase/flavanone 3-hydroxylase-like [Cucurbita pepo subsp. pepo]